MRGCWCRGGRLQEPGTEVAVNLDARSEDSPSALFREAARCKRKLVDRDTIARVAESLTCPNN